MSWKLWDDTEHFFFQDAPNFSEKPMKLVGSRTVHLNGSGPMEMFLLLHSPQLDPSKEAPAKDPVFIDLVREFPATALIGWDILKYGVLTVYINTPKDNKLKLPDNFKMPYNQTGLRDITWVRAPDYYGYVPRIVDIGSPADKAGIQVGDHITHMNGHPITARSFARDRDALYGINSNEVEIKFIRGEEKMETTLTLFDYLFADSHRQ